MPKFRFNRSHFIIATALFVVLVLIALFVRDQFIRPVFGDFLVVVFMYYVVASIVDIHKGKLTIILLLFSYAVEIGQYYHLVEHLGLKGNAIAETIIGTGFSWIDMLAYTFGAITVYVWEAMREESSV